MARFLQQLFNALCRDESAQPTPHIDPVAALEEKNAAYFLEEYKSLRAEVLKRTELQQQIVNFALIVTGAFFTLGTTASVNGSVFFLHPVVMTVFAIAWVDHDQWIGRIARYLRKIEKKRGLGWEKYLHQRRECLARYRSAHRIKSRWQEPLRDMAFVSTRILFLACDLIAVGLGMAKLDLKRDEWVDALLWRDGASLAGVLLPVAVIALVLTVVVIRRTRLEHLDADPDDLPA